MKKSTRILALLCALVLLLSSLASCGGKAKALLTLYNQSLSVNTYRLMLSIRKGEMAFAISQGYGNANSEKFWGTVIDDSSTTYDDYYTAEVFNKARSYLAALALFDELGLTLPNAYIKAVDEEMATLVAEDGEGSKAKLNSILSEFGANYDILREYKLTVKKIEWLMLSLYGENASKVSATVKDSYFKENYVAFQQILLSNFYYLFETDIYGDDVYYNSDGSIAYDVSAGNIKLIDGAFVYHREDGRIAYDTENGKRKPITDEQGNQLTERYTTGEMLDRLNLAINLRDTASQGSAPNFQRLRLAYTDEDLSDEEYSDTLSYLATNVSYASISTSWSTLDAIASKLAEMEIGEIAIVQTDAGIHIVRKYLTEAGAYADERYTQWFNDSRYRIYDFNSNLVNELLTTRLANYEAAIKVNTDLLKGLSLKTSPSNFYYN